jgi:hypothetical protein
VGTAGQPNYGSTGGGAGGSITGAQAITWQGTTHN